MSYINKLVKNQGESEDECLSVVGDLNGLHAISNIWDLYSDLLHIIGINGYIEGVKGKGYSSEQIEAFEAGLALFPDFFHKCYDEVKNNEIKTD